MGVLRWLDRIDPETWSAVCERIIASPPSSTKAAEEFLKSFGRKGSDSLVESFGNLQEEPDLLSSLLNSLLEEAVTEETWDLDKSLSQGFEKIPTLISALSPLGKIIDFRGIDHRLPAGCEPEDGCGLFGCISSESLAGCLPGMARFATVAEIAAALQEGEVGVIGRMFGRGRKTGKLAEQIQSEYLARHWIHLQTAVTETTRRGQLLGLGMST